MKLAILLSFFPVLLCAAPEFAPRQVVKAFDAIENPKLAAGNEREKVVQADELVLGVVVEGAARAYPIDQLTGPSREIINDKLGGRDIAATW